MFVKLESHYSIIAIYAVVSMLVGSLLGCSSSEPLDTVPSVDLARYAGKWYEIASFPNRFQKGCNCTTAEYELTGGDFVKVTNTCRKDSAGGEIDQVEGKAFIVEGSNNARLKVQFFWPFRGDYYIIDLAEDYSHAAVGNPGRQYLWILSRTPVIDSLVYGGILERVKAMGFDVTKLATTNQNCGGGN